MIGDSPVEKVVNWSDQRIDFQVPAGARSGDLNLIVGDQVSNALAFTVSDGAIYYVDPDGSTSGDDQPGSFDHPWLTLAHAASRVVPGDTVYLLSGIYRETLEPVRGGTASLPIMFKAYPCHEAYFDGEDLPGTPDGIRIDGSRYPGIGYLIFSGLQLRNYAESIQMLFGAHHCNFYGLDVSMARGGLFFYGASDAFVARCRFHNNGEYGVDFQNYSSNITIRDTVSDHNQTLEGAGFEADASVENVTLYRCTSSANVGDGFDLRVDGLELFECQAIGNHHGIRLWRNAVVRNSIVLNNSGDGIQCQNLNAETPVQTILNCTIAGSGASSVFIGQSSLVRLQNTIAVDSVKTALFFENGMDGDVLDHLILHSKAGESDGAIYWGDDSGNGQIYTPGQIASGQFSEQTGLNETIGLIADPAALFVDYANGNLKLNATSAAIDFGDAEGVPAIDLERRPRLVGITVDSGAYEYSAPLAACRDWMGYE